MLVIGLLNISCNTKSKTVTKPDQKPNILFIMADDHAIQAISAYGHPISKLAPTPNIDRLAKNGVILITVSSQILYADQVEP